MIWIRRFFALFLGLLFLPLFLVTLLLLRTNDTFLNADFYVTQLRKADLFNFLYDDLLPAAVDEIDDVDVGDTTLPLNRLAERGVILLRDVFPPDWLQEEAEQVVQGIVPYITGYTDEFSIGVPVADRLDTLGLVVSTELQEGSLYTLIFDDLVTPLAAKQLEEGEALPFGVTLQSNDVVAAVQGVVPPQWIQERVEHVTSELVPYLAGESDSFAIIIPLADRIQAAAPVTKELLVRSNVYSVLSNPEFQDEVAQQLDQFANEQTGELACGVTLTSGQIVAVAQQVLDRRWLQEQVEGNIDRAVLYLTDVGQDTIIVLPLNDRIQGALAGNDAPVKVLLRDVQAYEKLYRNCVVPEVVDLVAQAVGGGASPVEDQQPAFSLDVTETIQIVVTQQEVSDVLLEVVEAVSSEWIREQVEGAVDQVVPYVVGEVDHFAVELSLADVVEPAGPVIERLVERKLLETYNALPECSVQDALALAQGGLGEQIPVCRPTGFTAEQVQGGLGIPGPAVPRGVLEEFCGCDLSLAFEGVTLDALLDTLGLDVGDLVAEQLDDILPSVYVFCDAEVIPGERCDAGLRESIGDEDQESLDDVLDWTRNGFTYTDADLREDLGEEDVDDILEWTREGFTYTDTDLREDNDDQDVDAFLRLTRGGFTQVDLRDQISELDDFDTVRDRIGLVRSLSFLLYVGMGLSLASIGFLGGRRWPSRIAWASVVLGIAAAVAYIGAGPVYDIAVQPLLDDAREDFLGEDPNRAEVLLVGKALDIADTVADDFVSGIAGRALMFLLVALAGIGLYIFWPLLFRSSRSASAPQDEHNSS